MYYTPTPYYTPIDSFLNKFRRPGFLLYIGLVVGALGWSFWEMHVLSARLREVEERQKKEAEERWRLRELKKLERLARQMKDSDQPQTLP